jgi:HxlR-like helix-turn-helix
VPYHEHPTRYDYTLTDKGAALYPVIVSLLAWGDQWMADERGPSLTIIHESCGATATPELRCANCGQPVVADDTHHVVAGR